MSKFADVTRLAEKARTFQTRIDNCKKKYGLHVLVALRSQIIDGIASWRCIHCGISYAPTDIALQENQLRLYDLIKSDGDTFALVQERFEHLEQINLPACIDWMRRSAERDIQLVDGLYNSSGIVETSLIPRFKALETVTGEPL